MASMECYGDFLVQSLEEVEDNEPVAAKRPKKKPKVTKDWDEEDVLKLISCVEAEKCLWDASDESYHNKSLRDRAWRYIADNFEQKYSVTDLTAKWTNLRIQFRGYASRTKTKSGQGTVETPKWRFYNALKFVGRNEDKQTQQTVSNLDFVFKEENISSKSSGADTQTTTQETKKQQAASSQSAATQIVETMREAVSAMKQRSEKSLDPDNNMANYIVSELKTLKAEAAEKVRKKVMFYFLECLEEERDKEKI